MCAHMHICILLLLYMYIREGEYMYLTIYKYKDTIYEYIRSICNLYGICILQLLKISESSEIFQKF